MKDASPPSDRLERYAAWFSSWLVAGLGTFGSIVLLTLGGWPPSLLGMTLTGVLAYYLFRRSVDYGEPVQIPTQVGRSPLGWWIASDDGYAWVSEEGAKAAMSRVEAPRLWRELGSVGFRPQAPTNLKPMATHVLWRFLRDQLGMVSVLIFIGALFDGASPVGIDEWIIRVIGAVGTAVFSAFCLSVSAMTFGYIIGLMLLTIGHKLADARHIRSLVLEDHRLVSGNHVFHLHYPQRAANLGFDSWGTYLSLRNQTESWTIYGDYQELVWLQKYVVQVAPHGDEDEVPDALRQVQRQTDSGHR